jgi:hypothetical protein
VLIEYYNKIATFLTETFGANFILFTILLTTAAAIIYFIVIGYSITQMDKRYFVRKRININKAPFGDASEAPQSRLLNKSFTYLIKIAKIIFGVCLFVLGLLMLILPGQGLITMLIGLSLFPFPGKDKLEQNLLSRKLVRSSLNWIRIKANKEPFIFSK